MGGEAACGAVFPFATRRADLLPLTIEQNRTLNALDELVDTMLRRLADDDCGDSQYRIDYNGAEPRKFTPDEAFVFEVRAQGLHIGFVTIEPDGSMRFA